MILYIENISILYSKTHNLQFKKGAGPMLDTFLNLKFKYKIILVFGLLFFMVSLITQWLVMGNIKGMIENEYEIQVERYAQITRGEFNAKYGNDKDQPWRLEVKTNAKGEKVETLFKGKEPITNEFNVDQFSFKQIKMTIFKRTMREATNVIKKGTKDTKAVNTAAAANVIETVMNKGVYAKEADVQGVACMTRYEPLLDKNGNVIGMWFVGFDRTDMVSLDLDGRGAHLHPLYGF